MLAIRHFLGAVRLHRHSMRQNLFRIVLALERKIDRRIVHVQVNLGVRARPVRQWPSVPASGFSVLSPCRFCAFKLRSDGSSSTNSGVP